jgi:hypothetical protein
VHRVARLLSGSEARDPTDSGAVNLSFLALVVGSFL